ncbi:MAG: DUF1194 domain-containing protein [Alphaproteobacteria bacterium]|nr:DUF1194 domain-containing protein [Alphaproteobacteria bacterium]
MRPASPLPLAAGRSDPARRQRVGRRRALATLGAAGALAALPAIRRARADDPVDVALVLAVDVSRSIDDDEARLQREGYRAAITDRRIVAAIQGGMVGAVGLVFMEWASASLQRVVVPWRRIDGMEAARAFADAIGAADRVAWPRTSISAALDYSVRLLADCPYEATRKVIDVSGDGVNNHGRPLELARKDALDQGITINGLPIINDRGGPGMGGPWGGGGGWGWPSPPWLGDYFRDQVIGGPGAFVIVAEGFESFGQAVQRKLIREIA